MIINFLLKHIADSTYKQKKKGSTLGVLSHSFYLQTSIMFYQYGGGQQKHPASTGAKAQRASKRLQKK